MERAVIEGIFSINGKLAHILFNSGATHSLIVQELVNSLKLTPEVLRSLVEIMSLVSRGEFLYWTYS